jgi:hypothetical protein
MEGNILYSSRNSLKRPAMGYSQRSPIRKRKAYLDIVCPQPERNLINPTIRPDDVFSLQRWPN